MTKSPILEPISTIKSSKHKANKSVIRQQILSSLPKKIKGKNKEFVEGYNNAIDDIVKNLPNKDEILHI